MNLTSFSTLCQLSPLDGSNHQLPGWHSLVLFFFLPQAALCFWTFYLEKSFHCYCWLFLLPVMPFWPLTSYWSPGSFYLQGASLTSALKKLLLLYCLMLFPLHYTYYCFWTFHLERSFNHHCWLFLHQVLPFWSLTSYCSLGLFTLKEPSLAPKLKKLLLLCDRQWVTIFHWVSFEDAKDFTGFLSFSAWTLSNRAHCYTPLFMYCEKMTTSSKSFT